MLLDSKSGGVWDNAKKFIETWFFFGRLEDPSCYDE